MSEFGRVPPSDWIIQQALLLSSDKDDKDKIGALAWNLSVAFKRWAEQGESTPPLVCD